MPPPTRAEPEVLTLDGEDERRVAVGVLRVDVDPRQLQQLARLLLPTFKEKGRRLVTLDHDDEVVCLVPGPRPIHTVLEQG